MNVQAYDYAPVRLRDIVALLRQPGGLYEALRRLPEAVYNEVQLRRTNRRTERG